MSKGSRDNMTVILVCFDAAPTVDPIAMKREEEWKQKITDRVYGIHDTKLKFKRCYASSGLVLMSKRIKIIESAEPG